MIYRRRRGARWIFAVLATAIVLFFLFPQTRNRPLSLVEAPFVWTASQFTRASDGITRWFRSSWREYLDLRGVRDQAEVLELQRESLVAALGEAQEQAARADSEHGRAHGSATKRAKPVGDECLSGQDGRRRDGEAGEERDGVQHHEILERRVAERSQHRDSGSEQHDIARAEASEQRAHQRIREAHGDGEHCRRARDLGHAPAEFLAQRFDEHGKDVESAPGGEEENAAERRDQLPAVIDPAFRMRSALHNGSPASVSARA